MTEFKNILLEKRDKIAVVTLNRPEMMNALNLETIRELADLFTELERDAEVLGVIVTGGGRAFCAGADVSSAKNDGGNPHFATRSFVVEGQNLMNQIEAFSHPVIAAVNGFALGGGSELALACDLRIASEKAVFGLPEVTLGVMPCFGGTQRLPRLIGMARAKEIIYTGRKVKAEEALAVGLVNEVVAPEELLGAAEAKMQAMVACAPLAIKLAKTAMNKGIQMPLHEALELEADMTALLGTTEDAMEGGRAFGERRKPIFKNR